MVSSFVSLFYFLITSLMVFNILFTIVILFFMFVFYFVYSAFFVLFPLLYTAVSFPFFVKVYRPLPSVGNPIAVNKYLNIN